MRTSILKNSIVSIACLTSLELIKSLGNINDPKIDEEISLHLYHETYRLEKHLEVDALMNDTNQRVDLRDLYFCTIDPNGARDHDDAIYFDKLPLSQGMAGYGNENYNSGYSTGFDDGFRSVDNLEWLENVATAVKDIFSVEIFPGFTVGFIVLFPLVIAIVKWFLSLFGIGGGS